MSFPAVPNTSGDYTQIYQVANTGTLTGQTWFFSVWIYATAASSINIAINDHPITEGANSTPSLAIGWNHISIGHTFTGTATAIQVSITRGQNSPAASYAIYCPMLEWAAGASSSPVLTNATNLPAQLGYQLWRSSAPIGGSNYLLEMIQNVSVLAGVYVNGSIVSAGSYTLSNFPGVITFNSPLAVGSVLAWEGNFNYVAHFLEDTNDFEEFLFQLWDLKTLKLESVQL